MNELDLLRAWQSDDGVPPSAEVRQEARRRLEYTFDDRGRGVSSRFVKRVAVAAVVMALLVAGGIVWAQREVDDRLDRMKTVTVPPDALGNAEIGKHPVTILVVGADPRRLEGGGAGWADTIILVRLDADGVHGVWLPRDLLVAGGPINAFSAGGPQALIDVIRSDMGITVDHYVEMSFRGFLKMVDRLDGVPVYSPGHIRDVYSGLDLPGPGCQTLDGETALEWVRSRHVEIERDGVWSDLSPRADLDRQARQQTFLLALARRAKQVVGDDPTAALDLADSLVELAVVDEGFGRDEVLALVGALTKADAADLDLRTVPVSPAADGAHLVLSHPAAEEALEPFAPGPATASPTTVPAGPSIVPPSTAVPAC